jgi:hypothetical protein
MLFQTVDESYDRTLDIHSIPSAAYPPMSRWVLALAFVRSASRGVDAASCSFTGSLPLWKCKRYGDLLQAEEPGTDNLSQEANSNRAGFFFFSFMFALMRTLFLI